MRCVIALVAIAAIGFAGAAYAGDAGPKAMNDSDLDKVTAGTAGEQEICVFRGTDHLVGGNLDSQGINHRSANNGFVHSDGRGAHFEAIQP
jgi:hypothetical protein